MVHIKTLCRARSLGLTALLGVLSSGCASAGRPAAVPPADLPVDPPTYLAQSAVNACRPGDSSLVCCIKKFPLTAVDNCGATATEVAEVLNGARVLNEAAQTIDGESAGKAVGNVEEDDEAHNAHLPEWKRECIEGYKNCQEFGWTGNCYDCLRYCEGQHACRPQHVGRPSAGAGEPMDPLDIDWYQVRMLNNRVQQGQALELTDDVRDLLRRTARTVAISDTEAAPALTDVKSATALLQNIRHRVDDGTHRIMRALDAMYRLRKKGDIPGARQQMQDVLAVEVVPHFREIAEGQLEELDALP